MENLVRKAGKETIEAFCVKHHIKRLSLFGSQLRGNAGRESDIDLLVEFDPGKEPGLLGLAAMESELSDLLDGQAVDLRTPKGSRPLLQGRSHPIITGPVCETMIA